MAFDFNSIHNDNIVTPFDEENIVNKLNAVLTNYGYTDDNGLLYKTLYNNELIYTFKINQYNSTVIDEIEKHFYIMYKCFPYFIKLINFKPIDIIINEFDGTCTYVYFDHIIYYNNESIFGTLKSASVINKDTLIIDYNIKTVLDYYEFINKLINSINYDKHKMLLFLSPNLNTNIGQEYNVIINNALALNNKWPIMLSTILKYPEKFNKIYFTCHDIKINWFNELLSYYKSELENFNNMPFNKNEYELISIYDFCYNIVKHIYKDEVSIFIKQYALDM